MAPKAVQPRNSSKLRLGGGGIPGKKRRFPGAANTGQLPLSSLLVFLLCVLFLFKGGVKKSMPRAGLADSCG